LDGLPAGLPTSATAGPVKDTPRDPHGSIYPAPRIAYFRDLQYRYKIINFKRADLFFTGKWLSWITGDRDVCRGIWIRP
jgi:hypothetical protein